jgi:tetratricopeptide (TPR) repeat protein
MNFLNFFFISLILFSTLFSQNKGVENAKLYQRARSLAQAGLTDEAMNLYNKLLSEDPSNHQYYDAYKRFLINMGDQEKILLIATNYYKNNKNDPVAYFEWIYGLILNQKENWQVESNVFIKENYSNNNLMRQLIFSMYSAGLSNELKLITNLMREYRESPSFLSRELGDIYIMRMDYKSGVLEYILYLQENLNDVKLISDKVMGIPKNDYIVNEVRELLKADKNEFSKIILSNLEFREENYQTAWNILKSQSKNEELQLEMGKDLLENNEFNFAEMVFRDILNNSKNPKVIEHCIFNIGRTLELKSIHNANKLPISGFYRGNPFFTPPFISINNSDNSLESAISIYDSLSINSNSHDAKYRLAEIKFRALGDLDGANDIFSKIFKSTKKYEMKRNCALRMIEIDIAKGDLFSAKNKIEKFSQFINKNPDNNLIRIKSAQILMFEGSKDSLNSYLRNTMKLMKSTDSGFNDVLDVLSLNLTFQNSGNFYSDFGKAQFLIHQNKRQEAIYILEEMTEIPDLLLAELIQYQIIYLYLMQKQYIPAIELAFIMNGETIYSELAYILQCEIADYIQNDLNLAVDLYLEFLEKYPDSIYYDSIRLRLRELAS